MKIDDNHKNRSELEELCRQHWEKHTGSTPN